MLVPNKVTLVAAALNAISDGEGKLWTDLTDAEKAPLNKVAEFLCQYTTGASLTQLDRAKLAAVIEKQFPELKANANHVVTLFLNIALALG